MTRDDPNAEDRQVGVVARDGAAATFTGARCMDWAGGIAGDGFAAQGNILAGPGVVQAIAETFVHARGALADRLLAALAAGQAAGGDRRGKQSAALYIAKPAAAMPASTIGTSTCGSTTTPSPSRNSRALLELHKLYFFEAAPEDVLTIDATLGAEIAALLRAAGARPAGLHTTRPRATRSCISCIAKTSRIACVPTVRSTVRRSTTCEPSSREARSATGGYGNAGRVRART